MRQRSWGLQTQLWMNPAYTPSPVTTLPRRGDGLLQGLIARSFELEIGQHGLQGAALGLEADRVDRGVGTLEIGFHDDEPRRVFAGLLDLMPPLAA